MNESHKIVLEIEGEVLLFWVSKLEPEWIKLS